MSASTSRWWLQCSRYPGVHVYLWGLLGLGSATATVVGVVLNRPARERAWLLVALAISTFAAGDITYDVLTEFLHQANPFPSIADGFYLATPLLLVAGQVTMIRARRRRDGDTGALLDALIITVGFGALSWIYLIGPYVHANDLSLPAKLTSVAYPLGDIVILCVLARLVFGGGTRNTSVLLLTTGALGLLGSDVIYGWIQLNGSWKVGGPTDVGWVLFYVCWGAAALHPDMRALTVEQPRRVRHLNPATLVLLSAVTLVAPVLIVWRDATGTPRDAGVLAGATVAVFVLVMFRMSGLARAQAVSARRELVLRRFSERLVAAPERSDVWQAAVDAVGAMNPAAVIGCLVVTATDGSAPTIVAASWPDLTDTAAPADPAHRPDDRGAVHLDGGGRPAGTSAATTWTRVAGSPLGGVGEQMLVAHDRPLPVDLAAVLDSISAEATLALGRVELSRVVHEARTERRFQSIVAHSSDLVGTGYSSLSYLADLPVSVVKIDKSFIDRLASGADGTALVRGAADTAVVFARLREVRIEPPAELPGSGPSGPDGTSTLERLRPASIATFPLSTSGGTDVGQGPGFGGTRRH